MSDFKCPKCGGPHFGRDTGVVNGQIDMLETVQCHNADDGGPMLAFEDRIASGKPRQTPCGWRGVWPPPQQPRPKGRAWTESDDALLRSDYKKVSTKELSEKLERTIPAIHRRAASLGLHNPRKRRCYCPKCGTEQEGPSDFACGSFFDQGTLVRSYGCERIAELQAQVHRLLSEVCRLKLKESEPNHA